MTWFPSLDYVVELYRKTIGKPFLMNRGGLATSLDKSMHGVPFHDPPTIWDSVTILFKEIVENHYFDDGNKRIGILLAFLFLEKNGYEFSPPTGDVFDVTMAVAQGAKTADEIKEWFVRHSIAVE